MMPVRSVWWLFCWSIAIFVGCAAGAESPHADENCPKLSVSLARTMLQAVESQGDTRFPTVIPLRWLTLQWAAPLCKEHPALARRVVQTACGVAPGDLLGYRRAPHDLAAAGPSVVPHIVSALATPETSEEASLILVLALGCMDPPLERPVPFLKAKLRDAGTPAGLRPAIRVALANLQEFPGDVVDEIDRDLAGEQWQEAAWAIAITRPRGRWITSGMVEALAARLDAPLRESLQAIFALGALGHLGRDVGIAALPGLRRALARSYEKPDPYPARAAIHLAIAAIDPANRRRAVREALKDLGRRFSPHPDFPFVAQLNATLVDAEVLEMVIRMIEEPDPSVAQGASTMLTMVSGRANAAVPALARQVVSERHEEVRVAAAFALSTTVAPWDLRPIERLLEERRFGGSEHRFLEAGLGAWHKLTRRPQTRPATGSAGGWRVRQ